MLKRKVIVDGIISLTDARYFAAAGVDFLLFDLSLNSIADIVEIKNWIEGPEILLAFEPDHIDLVEEALLKVSPKGITSTNVEIQEYLNGYPSFQQFEYSTTEESKQIEFEGQSFSSDFNINDGSNIGLILTVFGEEEVGVKQFDSFDEILESLLID